MRKQNSIPIMSKGKSNIPMIIMLFILVVFGLVILYSVSGPIAYSEHADSSYYVVKQIFFSSLGLVACFVIERIPMRWYNQRWIMVGVYAVALALIILTRLVGTAHGNAKRWLNLGFEFQTSELVKIAVVLCYAIYRTMIVELRKKGKLVASNPKYQALKDAFLDFILPVGCMLVLDVFILIQPHFSCFIIVGLICAICVLVSGVKLKSWLIGMAVFIPVGALCIGIFMASSAGFRDKILRNFSHVFKRFEIYAAQDADEGSSTLSEDDTRQVDSASNALGSGGVWGLGLGNSRSKYSYVSEAENDYIFSVYVEETGLVGGTILILIYLVVFTLGMNVARKTKTVFGRIIAVGYTFLIMIEAMLNIAVELKVIPATGVTLPFVSYGGTAQVLLFVAFGMVLCVSRTEGTMFKPQQPAIEQQVNLASASQDVDAKNEGIKVGI